MGYSRFSARCVPLQYSSSATHGVKQALNKSTHQNIIVLPSPFQENKSTSERALNPLNKKSTDEVSQTKSGMFDELSNRKQMECEKYQDCSWFQQSPMKSDHNIKLSLAETFDPFFEANEFDLPMQYADAQTRPWGDEYLEVFTDDIPLEETHKLGEKNKNYILNEDFYTDYKRDEDNVFDSYNINFRLKKTDSVDSMKNISSTNPAEVIPITYKEQLSNSNYGLTKLSEIKSEIKQELESSSSESNSCLMDSDDGILNIGREEVVENMILTEHPQLVCKKKIDTSYDVKSEVQADRILSEYAINIKRNNLEDIKFDENNFNQVSSPVKSEVCKSNNLPVAGKLDLILDVSKLNFDQTLSANTPDLDFMDLVDFINEEVPQEKVDTVVCNSTETSNVSQEPDPKQDIDSSKSQSGTDNAEINISKTSSFFENTEDVQSNDLKDHSTVDINEISSNGVSIAERIKTSAKRKTRTNVKDLIDTDGEGSCDSLDDEDYDVREYISRRRCAPIKRRTKSSLSESSGDGKRIKDDNTIYREKRDKNNEASRRSRQNRKARERHMYETLEDEERRNVKLKTEADILEKQVASLRQLLLQVVLRKGGAT